MGMQVDPVALSAFSKRAAEHAAAIRTAKYPGEIPANAFGSFEEATSLATALNGQLNHVNDRLDSTSVAIRELAFAAGTVAGLVGKSDEHIAETMKTVNSSIATAHKALQ